MPHPIRRIAFDGPDDVGRYLDLSDEPDVPDVVSLPGEERDVTRTDPAAPS
jgi:hypothetical protein